MAIFGLPPVDIHGPLHYVGIMDPLCGVTRGVRLTLQGHVARGWRFNPLSAVLVAGAIATLLRWAHGKATGRWINLNVVRRRIVLTIAAFLAVPLEINQQAHAALLQTTSARFSAAQKIGAIPAWMVGLMAASAIVIAGAVIVAQRRRRSGAQPIRDVMANRADSDRCSASSSREPRPKG